ncbi:hypothetical protein LSTR_LSTR001849, partial [Laodelphax striatellus]
MSGHLAKFDLPPGPPWIFKRVENHDNLVSGSQQHNPTPENRTKISKTIPKWPFKICKIRRREECERKARRGEMDPRLEFTFQLLIDGTGLHRTDINIHVFDGNMLDEINQLFLPHMRNKLLWFYQEVDEPDPTPPVETVKATGLRAVAAALPKAQAGPSGSHKKKKLFLTDGWQVPLTGICIYMFRLNTGKQLPEEGFHKDLFSGIIDATKIGLVTSVQRVMEHVFMEALAHPSPESEEEEGNCFMVKNQLLPAPRSFCSALKVCEEVCDEPNFFLDNIIILQNVGNAADAKELIRNPINVQTLEERVKNWIKHVQEQVLMESEQLRKENDSSGPQDELEYWKKRGAQFSQIVSQLKSSEVQLTIQCLLLARSKTVRQWKETDYKITYCYNEARDNAKFIQAMEKCCHALYLHDPVRMKDSILSLLQTVRLIHSVSQFYNTSERTSSLMVKITNQMIEQCKQYVTCRGKETIWSQERNDVREKLLNCIRLNRVYHNTYTLVKRQPFLPNQTPFSFSENYVFGKFDGFCDRLGKIISVFDLLDDYNSLFERRMEGLLLGEALEESMKIFEVAKNGVMSKEYDYLDQRNNEFDTDFDIFIQRTTDLREHVGNLIEENFASVWESPQGIRFLTRFEKVSEKIPLTRMDEKYSRILKYCEQEVERILKLFRKQKDDPPLSRNFPPIAGRIKWSRSLHCHLDDLVSSASAHPVLKVMPTTIELVRKYNYVANTLINYEEELKNMWMNHNVWVVDECLNKSLLTISEESGKFKVNLDERIVLLIRESECLNKMGLPVPVVTKTLLTKADYFTHVNDSLQFLLNRFLGTVRRVKLDVRPLFLPQLVRLASMLSPALNSINWTDPSWKTFLKNTTDAIQDFDVLVTRVHDIYSNRILQVLSSMQTVTLCVTPMEEPWLVDEFMEKTEDCCRQAAVELNRKSLMVEEAVEEVLELVRKAAEDMKANQEGEFDFLEGIEAGDSQSGGAITPSNQQQQQQQQDWSDIWECFENPQTLLVNGGGLSKVMQEMVRNAVSEMRRYYSRKVVDVLIKVTRHSLDTLRRSFLNCADGTPIFVLNAILMIPNVVIRPSLEEVQEALMTAGKSMTGVAKGVAQWTGGKVSQPSAWRRLGGGRMQGSTGTGFPPSNRALADVVSRLEQGPSTQQSEDLRTRRRKLYRLASEQKPAFPFQHRNFYSHVMENKEVVKMLALLATCTQDVRPELTLFLERWSPFRFLWENESTKKDIQSVNLLESESSLRRHKELEAQLVVEPEYFLFTASITISVGKSEIFNHKFYKKNIGVRLVMETLKKIREQEVDMELRIEPIEEAFNCVTRYDIPVDREDLESVDSLRYSWQRMLGRAMDVNVLLLTMQPHFQEDLRNNLERFRLDNIEYCHEYRTSGPMMPGLTPREASDRLILFQNRFDGMWRKLQTYQNGEELFGLPQTDYPELAQIRKELNLLQKLYKLYNDVIDRVSSYYDIPWGEVNIEEINNELMEFQNRCRKLPKGLKEWPAFHALKRTIDDFNDMCPLLELMANKAMKPRHWQKIMEVTKYNFELDSEGFCLKNILEAPLLKNKEDIEDICISAMKEKDIEGKLRQVTNEWSVHELTFMTFNNRGELLLRGDTTAETIGQLEDSLMVLGSLLSNRYNAPFRKQIQQWVYDLGNTNEILERWLLVQNMWVYLEAVFVGGDIAKQLPKEAKRFSKIDKSWQKIMQRAHETPGVVSCCVGDDMLKQLLPHLQEQLELCQKSLSGYLEKKRMMFPRFFFVSDPALLEILGQASDSHTIQNHLLSIFDNTRSVKFHDIEYNKMTAIISSEGELIQLERAVRAEGSVETWLTCLLQTSQMSLHSIIRTAHTVINDPNFNLLAFLDKMPAQIGILGIQMIWTRDSELALMQARSDKKMMPETNNKFLELLNTLIDQTTRDLNRLERTKFETLITIHVHQRDIFDILCRLNVRSVNDFEWLKQCRFYFKEDLDKTWISITDVTFTYQNEYLGCTERLVITPLTDRCYITLAQALAMSMGGSPCGPAGTGKTETVKDMGKTLAKYVVVFNCSDQMDYRGLGRIYKGLAQSGSWGCFDEFNRIELPVLSVAAQQVAVVQAAKKEKKKQFVFTDGDVIDMCPEFGILITMNPGYAGRKELPENLKIQFRTVAMMVPDRQIIIRVKLASCGFLENITLARKFYTLYKLCEEQLTKQVHYDFDEDEPLFISLVADLFPNQVLEKTSYPQLESAILGQVEEAGLIYHPPWVLKLIQLYETQRVRHGIMTLGPAGAGKTACIHTLMKALTVCGEPHREMRMNPKAITASQMFGRLDVATNDWTDGIFAALWRKTLKIKKGDHVWLVLDGPVDSIWIENLNSVLDDNKTLTLANGDRLSMAPTCKIIFEPHNIDNASPATVSRNGMVYMSSSGLDWKPVLDAWLKTRTSKEVGVFQQLFDESFAVMYSWGTQNLNLTMKVLQCNIVQQMLFMLQGLVPTEIEVEEPEPKAPEAEEGDDKEPKEVVVKLSAEHLKRLYVFSLIWGMGAFLDNADRAKFDSFLREKLMHLDLPKSNVRPKATVFDFVVGKEGKWELWDSMLSNYTYPENSTPDYSSILVPIIDNVRIDYLINCIAKQGKAVILIGEGGSAKTVMMKSYMKKSSPDVHLSRSFNFSSATSPYQFQKTIESYVEKRMGNMFGPSGGRKMTVFIDDINLPEINEWGDQVTNEIVRQTMDMKGFYSLEKPGEFITIVDVQFVAAMNQPGGGRNDIPSRLKRQFCIFNCPLPSDSSIDKIFSVIGEGHYNVKRGFTSEVRSLIKQLIPLTRLLWQTTRLKLLPTPAKFHYVFSLRDLSRIWQGMVGTLSTVIDSEDVLMVLWKHECTRVFSDRFTLKSDKDWFDEALLELVEQKLGPQYKEKSLPDPVFVDFMRDAPEPTGEEGEDTDMELPKVYEPVSNYDELRERLDMFLAQFNEMVRGAGMDLVFFPDAMMHLVKISRVIRHPRGNVMLVGVGGSGKQSLTKLASFIAGYKTFQIALTRSYNVANFLEDLKLLYRTCGVQGKGTTFIFTDLDIKEEGFLEYLNNILSSGVISNLFTKDEQQEIISELTPVMKRENPKCALTHENVMEHFLVRTCQNLHVVFCFSPVGEKFRNRALRFPALVSGCTIDWFQPWPKDALVAVAEHFISDFEIECTDDVKKELVNALGFIQDVVSTTSSEYFQRYRRATHVTPKSYLNFIGGYKNIYKQKQKELGEGAARMDT